MVENMKPLLSKEEIADLLAPLKPDPETKTGISNETRSSESKEAANVLQPLHIRVEVSHTPELLKELQEINKGTTVKLDMFSGIPLDLYKDDNLIARCELVHAGTTFSIKVTEVIFS